MDKKRADWIAILGSVFLIVPGIFMSIAMPLGLFDLVLGLIILLFAILEIALKESNARKPFAITNIVLSPILFLGSLVMSFMMMGNMMLMLLAFVLGIVGMILCIVGGSKTIKNVKYGF